MFIFKRFFRKIYKIIRWIPILWNDYEFDDVYIFKILDFKLKLMEEFFNSKYAWAVDAPKFAKQIHIVRLFLKRIIEDDYSAFKEHDKKWGEIKMSSVPVEGRKNLCELIIEREFAITEKEKEQEEKELLRCWEHDRYLKKQDIDYMFKYMAKHIQAWWD